MATFAGCAINAAGTYTVVANAVSLGRDDLARLTNTYPFAGKIR